jgi:hypothetical protein
MLAVLVSCNASNDSAKKPCNYNDVRVECDGMDGTAETDFIVANASSTFSMTKNEIEILEDAEDEQFATINGETKNCTTGFEAGFRSAYKISGNKLILKYEGDSDDGMKTYTETFSRQGQGNDLLGTWVSTVKTEDGFDYTKLSFTEKSVKSTIECHFYR